MGRLLGGILAIAVASGQPVPSLGTNLPAPNWFGPKIVYPGYTTYYAFAQPLYRVPVTCSSTGNTCDTAGSGYTPTGAETNVNVSATTLPTGLDFATEGVYAPYDIHVVSGTTFQFYRHGTTTVETFSSTGSGVNILLPSSTYHAFTDSFYVATNTAARMGWPTGTTVTWGYAGSTSTLSFAGAAFTSTNGYPYNFLSIESLVLKVDIPTNATPGNYTITITDCDTDPTVGAGTCAGGANSDTLTFTVTVTALTYLSDATQPSSFPAISGLSTWVNYMTTGAGINGGDGDDWCTKAAGVTFPSDLQFTGNDSYVSYYDGALGYWRVGLWTGDTGWQKCTQNILQQMAWGNQYSIIVPHGVYLTQRATGYHFFPVGYSKAVSQDPRYIQVVQAMAGIEGTNCCGDAYVSTGGTIGDGNFRETSYALDVMMAVDALGLTPQDPVGTAAVSLWAVREQRLADELIGDLNAYVDGSGRYSLHQYFFDGIAMDALEKWWGRTKDPRVPMVVKPILDQFYSNYNLSLHIPMYNPNPNGVYCGAAVVWWYSNINGHCGNNTDGTNTITNNLFSHAFAWYWRLSGDDTYRTKGDEVFSHAFDGQDNFQGRTWAQLYRYSFNYVGWRQGWLNPERSIE